MITDVPINDNTIAKGKADILGRGVLKKHLILDVIQYTQAGEGWYR